ncbi:hypothetical protein DL347_10030 [Pseudomonas fluorescens]|uniref:Uncharacterized protein n=1 Tax=Pseudomonas fluorescens TaxID=294 RepID=A0A7Z6QPN7_PSEFL|nr:hypothetical protein DL347_10030 [Pseudomonas fluorescens]
MHSSKSISEQALKYAKSSYKDFDSFPIDGTKSVEDAERFYKLAELMTVSNSLYIDNLRVEHQCLKHCFESFQ